MYAPSSDTVPEGLCGWWDLSPWEYRHLRGWVDVRIASLAPELPEPEPSAVLQGSARRDATKSALDKFRPSTDDCAPGRGRT